MSFDDYDLVRPGVDYNYIRREYGEAVRRTGAQPVFLDPASDPFFAASLCDGVIISGGEDIDPTLYGENDRAGTQKEPARRTRWERQLIDACDALSVPIFGVCYGAQLLNVHYGGTLYQDIGRESHSALSHGSSGAPAIHAVTFYHEFMGFAMGDRAEVTSRHHQAVRSLAPGFTAAAAAADGTVEAIAGRGHTGVQWHPESDETAERLYTAFAEKCLRQKRYNQRMNIGSYPGMLIDLA